jgi:central glycolytic genes regulator
LVKALGYSERTIRNEVELLKEKGALFTTAAGIHLSDEGEEMLRQIDELIPLLFIYPNPGRNRSKGLLTYVK